MTNRFKIGQLVYYLGDINIRGIVVKYSVRYAGSRLGTRKECLVYWFTDKFNYYSPKDAPLRWVSVQAISYKVRGNDK